MVRTTVEQKQQRIGLEGRRRKNMLTASIIFLIPAAFFLIIFIFYPIVDTLRLSFQEWNGITVARESVGMQNWKELVSDQQFYRGIGNNLVIMFLSILLQLPVGIVIALFLDSNGKKVKFFKTAYFIPMLMSSVAIGFLFKFALDPVFGIITAISESFGGGIVDVIGNPGRALYAIIMVIGWQFIPFYMLYFLAALSSLPEEMYEAASLDGATRAQYYRNIAIPCIKGTIKSAAILSMVGSLKYFDMIYVMTEGGPDGATELMATYMYKNAFVNMKMGYGATIAFAMFLIITGVSLVTMRVLNGKGEQ